MSLIKANDIQNASGGIPTVKGQDLIPTAWVNFNGTGTVAIRDSEGVSSITDVSTATYRANFTTAMANTNYAAVGGCLGATSSLYNALVFSGGEALNTAYVKINIIHVNASDQPDTDVINVLVMGGQS